MSSASPADTQIFFKNMQNKLKGPFTERQVQEYYVQEWFDGSTKFCFMTGGDRPNEKTQFLTLETLCSSNGDDRPFASLGSESISESKADELGELDEVADEWATYYLDVLEAYKTNKWNKVDGERAHKMSTGIVTAIKSEDEPLLQKWRDVLMKKLKTLDYAYCAECDIIFYNYKQILMHVLCPHHNHDSDAVHKLQSVAVNTPLREVFFLQLQRLADAEMAILEGPKRNYGRMDASSPGLRPLAGFIDNFKNTYGDAVFDYSANLNSSRAEIVAKMIPRLKQNDRMGRKMMSELHEHLGDNMTRCYDCGVYTGGRAEYYEHLRLHYHLSLPDKANAMDLITIVVNLFQKD